MSNPLYNALNGAQNAKNAQGYNNPMQMLAALKNDPSAVLRARGLNVPNGMNNPQEIIQHLLTSGQVPHGRYQQLLQNMQQFKR